MKSMDDQLAGTTKHPGPPQTDHPPTEPQGVLDREIHLSRSPGGVSNTHLEPWYPTFSELCEQLRQPPSVEQKDGDYFVRGPFCESRPTRADANIDYSSLIILDADSSLDPETGELIEGAPPPESVHQVLVELDINHLIYTSYSHAQQDKGCRFRVLIPAVAEDAGQLKSYLRWIFHLLGEKGCWLTDVKENSTWSQPWYFPRLAEKDSEYLFFSHGTAGPFNTTAALEWVKAEESITPFPPDTGAWAPKSRDPDSVYAQFNDKHGKPKWMLKTLKDNGYKLQSTSLDDNGDRTYRLLSPHSTSGSPGILLFQCDDAVWRVFSHHNAAEPLSRDNDPVKISDAFDLFRILNHDGNEKDAISAWYRECDVRPVIAILPGNIPKTMAEAVSSLAAMRPHTVFQRAETLCRIANPPEDFETEGCIIPGLTSQIVTLQRAGLTVELSRAARWERPKKGGGWQLSDPCTRVTGALLEAVGMWGNIPHLQGPSEAPILRSDGTLLTTPGYDPETRLYVEGNFPKIHLKENPSFEDAKAAAETLLAPFSEFPVVDEELDPAGILAYQITLILRQQLATAPLFCFSATTPGSGKGLLVEACNRAMRGRDAATMPPVQGGSGEDETRKRITAILMRGIPSINMDNWTKPIGGESMNTLLTTSEWTDRQLGSSRTTSVPAQVTLAATGNNLSVRGDMTRRSILIQLDAKMERPELRTFDEPDLLGYIAKHRQELLTAAFTILKAYQVAGSPGCSDNPLGRFEQWSAAVCGPIRWMGYPDPVKSQERLREQDPEADRLELLLSAWYDSFQDTWKTAGELIEAPIQAEITHLGQDISSPLKEALLEVASDGRNQISRNLLGWYLRRNAGRIADGYRLEPRPRAGKKSKNSKQYRVKKLNQPTATK